MALPTTEPEATLLVEVAEIARAMPDRLALGDLGKRRRFGTAEDTAKEEDLSCDHDGGAHKPVDGQQTPLRALAIGGYNFGFM